jgi:TonB family protein
MKKIVPAVAALLLAASIGAVYRGGEKPAGEPAIKLLKKVNPIYPEEAKKGKITGEVVLEVRIGKAGKVTEAKAVKSPDESLSKAAVDAVRQWEYEPVTKNGKAVEVKCSVTVNFRLK